MKYYRQLRCGVSDKNYKLIPSDANVYDFIDSNDEKDYYLSIYEYTEQQFNEFKKIGSISGVTDVTTQNLVFDFDNKTDLQAARADTITLCASLRKSFDIPENCIQVSFSGNKGFHVEIETDSRFTVQEFKNITRELSRGLPTFDKVVSDANRIFRVLGTKHSKSGLYKFPLTLQQLSNNNVEKIQELAKNIDNADVGSYEVLKISSKLFNLKNKKQEELEFNITQNLDIDFINRPKGWASCKHALAHGYELRPGDRKVKLVALVATCKGLNYSKEQAYYLAKNAYEKGLERYGGDPFSKEELWDDIVSRVYGPSWAGGTYSCRDGKTIWLTELCKSLGHNSCDNKSLNKELVSVENVFDVFSDYAENIEKNTIKTGIMTLDNKIRFRVGQMIGLLGAPSSGKTSIALNLLENTSRQGLNSVFYSLDMADSELFQKVIQKVSGKDEDEIFNIFKRNLPEKQELLKKVKSAFGNVKFSFDTGISVEAIQNTVLEYEKSTGQKVKLLLIDYNELLAGPYSDATANSGFIAGAMKKLTNQLGLCTIVLLQPAKVWGDASDELSTYRATKGSSLLEQCFSIILGIFRPGFSAQNNSEDDNYMVMNTLKNRMGKLLRFNFHWNGLRGEIKDIDPDDSDSLEEIKHLIENKKAEKDTGGF